MKANGTKSIHVTYIMRKETYPPITLNDLRIPQFDAKYIRLHLDRSVRPPPSM